jgi:DNA mismatch repair ATPase MutS
VDAINARLDAVEEFAAAPDLVGQLRRLLKGLPDLERALGQARNAASAPGLGLPQWMLEAAQRR